MVRESVRCEGGAGLNPVPGLLDFSFCSLGMTTVNSLRCLDWFRFWPLISTSDSEVQQSTAKWILPVLRCKSCGNLLLMANTTAFQWNGLLLLTCQTKTNFQMVGSCCSLTLLVDPTSDSTKSNWIQHAHTLTHLSLGRKWSTAC